MMSLSASQPPHGSQENQTQAFYDRISSIYDAISDSSEHVAREKGLVQLDAHLGQTALEIGFGTGHSLVALARAVGPTGKVIGFDISPGMGTVAHERLLKEGLADRVELKIAAIPPLPVDSESVDLVFMSFTLELFPDAEIAAVLDDVRRVLRPGGKLTVVGMAIENDPGVMERTYQWFHRHFPHIVDCHPIDIAGVLQQAGFSIEANESLEMWGLRVGIVTGNAMN